MKLCTQFVLAALLTLGIVGFAQAKDKAAKPLSGTIVKIDGANLTVKTHDGEVTVATDDKTVVTVDSVEAKLTDLKVGQHIKVTPATGTATKIEASSKKGKKDAK